MSKVAVSIDVTDWAEKALRAEEMPQSESDLFAMAVDQGLSARETAQMAIAARAMGESPVDILPDNKVLLGDGGRYRMDAMIRNAVRRIEIAGKEYTVREATSVVQEDAPESDDGPQTLELEAEAATGGVLPKDGYIRAGTPQSAENARRYLQRKVPGHIWERLKEIAAAGEDPHGAVEELIAAVREMEERLV